MCFVCQEKLFFTKSTGTKISRQLSEMKTQVSISDLPLFWGQKHFPVYDLKTIQFTCIMKLLIHAGLMFILTLIQSSDLKCCVQSAFFLDAIMSRTIFHGNSESIGEPCFLKPSKYSKRRAYTSFTHSFCLSPLPARDTDENEELFILSDRWFWAKIRSHVFQYLLAFVTLVI